MLPAGRILDLDLEFLQESNEIISEICKYQIIGESEGGVSGNAR